MTSRRIQEVQESVNLERGIFRSPPRKREGEISKERREKKLKYPLISETWGEEDPPTPLQPPSSPSLNSPLTFQKINAPLTPSKPLVNKDDFLRKEDDLGSTRNQEHPVPTHPVVEEGEKYLSEDTPCPSTMLGHRRMSAESPPILEEGVLPDISTDKNSRGALTRGRAGNTTGSSEPGELEKDDSIEIIAKKKPGGITVNGKDLMDILREKKRKDIRNNNSSKETTPSRQKKPLQTAPSSGKKVDIRKFLVKKSEEKISARDHTADVILVHSDDIPVQNQSGISGTKENTFNNKNNKNTDNSECDKTQKTTFSTLCDSATVGDRVRRYQMMVRKSGSGCVMGSGRCATHNVKLVRSVCMKKVSDRNNADELVWRNRESTTLVCPASERFSDDNKSDKVVVNTQQGPTNKKSKLSRDTDENQSASIKGSE